MKGQKQPLNVDLIFFKSRGNKNKEQKKCKYAETRTKIKQRRIVKNPTTETRLAGKTKNKTAG